jgi:hypothetical protein
MQLIESENENENVDGHESAACPTEVTPEWKRVTMVVDGSADGEDFLTETLRSPEWLDLHRAVVGGTVWMEIEEAGIAGFARILNIEPAPQVEEGPGCVVLSRFTRQNDNLMELTLGSGETLELTDTHLLYSASRDRWIAAGALWEGEYLLGADATVPVIHLEALEGKRQVFNLEVENAHRYVVGETKVLAHNAGGGGCPTTAAPPGAGTHVDGPKNGRGDSIDGGDGPAGNTVGAESGQGASKGIEGQSPGATPKSSLPAGEAPYQLNLFPNEAYNRQEHYGHTPTAAQKGSVPEGMEFDHNPPLVEHFYEGNGPGSLPGYNQTPSERRDHARSVESGGPATPNQQRKQGGETGPAPLLWTPKR